ncbi:hypothetical protein QBC37DRAFT_459734 [Rhypophila decipiens]|uniref:Uncharacterized protein n=1 Tax=Rhypophila decipiens TaxID=261697 RepID=A0AAN7B2Y6_9PEZI|nr:hypothetical protein QBC37DRAFT_459734 [Rhypophila decipiens]
MPTLKATQNRDTLVQPALRGVHWITAEDGSRTAFTTSSWVSSATLKNHLDAHYAGRYSVELRRDVFKISIQTEAN